MKIKKELAKKMDDILISAREYAGDLNDSKVSISSDSLVNNFLEPIESVWREIRQTNRKLSSDYRHKIIQKLTKKYTK